MSTLVTHVGPVLFCLAVIAAAILIGVAQGRSSLGKAHRRAAGLAPARHARRATPLDHGRRIRRTLAARRPRIAPRPDALEALLSRRSAERLAQVTGGTR